MRLAVLFVVCGLSSGLAGCGDAAQGVADDRGLASDRNLKADVLDIDNAEVLAKVVDLQITTWRYKVDKADVRHLGPMAQDFFAAFNLANSEKVIHPLDASGVSLASIQALHSRLVAAEAENQQLLERVDALEQRLAALESR